MKHRPHMLRVDVQDFLEQLESLCVLLCVDGKVCPVESRVYCSWITFDGGKERLFRLKWFLQLKMGQPQFIIRIGLKPGRHTAGLDNAYQVLYQGRMITPVLQLTDAFFEVGFTDMAACIVHELTPWSSKDQ